MNSSNPPSPSPIPPKGRKGQSEIILREHVYDGIQEYDQRLPNWWLFTLYGAIIFSFFYWLALFQSNVVMSDPKAVSQQLVAIEAARLANLTEVTDESLWAMAANGDFVSSGKAHFTANCVNCHGENLMGGVGGGVNLVDAEWIHGSTAVDVYNVISNGVQEKGMPSWGRDRGQDFVMRATAYVLSYHHRESDGRVNPGK